MFTDENWKVDSLAINREQKIEQSFDEPIDIQILFLFKSFCFWQEFFYLNNWMAEVESDGPILLSLKFEAQAFWTKAENTSEVNKKRYLGSEVKSDLLDG